LTYDLLNTYVKTTQQPAQTPKAGFAGQLQEIMKMIDGKKKKPRSRNALVHGLYSKDVLLPWDSKDDFEKLHQELRTEFFPCGRAEEEAVLDLAHALWTKHTLWRMRQAAVLKDPFMRDIAQTKSKSWRGLRKELRAEAGTARSFLTLSRTVFTELLSAVRTVQGQLLQTSDRDEIKNLDDKLGRFISLLADRAVPFFHAMVQAPNAEKSFDNAYHPESMERMVRLEAALDARIAKILARLAGLKEFKRTPAGGAVAQLEVDPRG